MVMRDFDGFTVVITGASTGLGRAIAVEVARRGAALVVVNYASSAEEARETARLVEAEGAKATLVQGDVAREEDCRKIAAAAEPTGRIDALFNNAGVTKFAPNHADLDAVNAEDFLGLYSVNVVGAFQMVRAARALLEAAPAPGAVVNTSSIAAVQGIGSSIPYAASKGAMTTMTLSLARSLGPRIRVNAICPGFIDTPWFKNMSDESLERLRAGAAAATPLKVASTAEDIAGAAVFLASPASRHITGETLLVDAGLHLGGASLAMR
ncbi:SDR family NAD(P)-dependent oxidoreductase [Caulobacter segnis]|uniref:SDR family NAD(P)-dependent oxidoreductase n=1 Tax=Caulobacter segnis TaxID=88688 RepID=UPI001CBE1524|nr:SDR family NAD(P)-dependent oxidoreductase [Caulobacter segnis]UAL09487.1 SDR family oxidoreductase [Caulobacter segnis]